MSKLSAKFSDMLYGKGMYASNKTKQAIGCSVSVECYQNKLVIPKD